MFNFQKYKNDFVDKLSVSYNINLEDYKGSLISAIYIFLSSIYIWNNSNYHIIPLIIGINGLNFI